MSRETELQSNGILSWERIKDDYQNPDLLLGNGFSIQFSERFSYKSLFEIFLTKCDSKHRDLFSHFETTNFELILKNLTYALKVNSILILPTKEIEVAIEELKNGLIKTIEEVHPRIAEINFDELKYVALQLKDFGDIFTTNYDLYLYHLIMQSKDINEEDPQYTAYQDYFWGNLAPTGFKQFMEYQSYTYKHIYYLHGSLFIFKEGIMDIKILRDKIGGELIDKIANQIRNDKFPIFITEGSETDKLKSINESNYLRFCLNRLKDSTNPILIFGSSLREFDKHILDAIKSKPKNIVYCLYIADRHINDLNAEKQNFLANFNNYPNSIVFVDSSTIFNLQSQS